MDYEEISKSQEEDFKLKGFLKGNTNLKLST